MLTSKEIDNLLMFTELKKECRQCVCCRSSNVSHANVSLANVSLANVSATNVSLTN